MQRAYVLLLLLLPNVSFAQTEQELEVLTVIDRFFATKAERDSAGLAAIMAPKSVLEYWFETGNLHQKKSRIRTTKYLRSLKKGADLIREHYWLPVVAIDEYGTRVTARYDLHVNGEPKQCGTSYFHLVKDVDRWKISSVLFNVEGACMPCPLGPPK
ncbi:MAG: hypothetical protein ABI432_10035 [Flavobacteriales bacterium]